MAKLSLKKTDQFEKYVFEYSWSTKNVDEATNKLINDIKVTYDTPGSQIGRRSSMELKFDSALSFVSLGLEIPINKVIFIRFDAFCLSFFFTVFFFLSHYFFPSFFFLSLFGLTKYPFCLFYISLFFVNSLLRYQWR